MRGRIGTALFLVACEKKATRGEQNGAHRYVAVTGRLSREGDRLP